MTRRRLFQARSKKPDSSGLEALVETAVRLRAIPWSMLSEDSSSGVAPAELVKTMEALSRGQESSPRGPEQALLAPIQALRRLQGLSHVDGLYYRFSETDKKLFKAAVLELFPAFILRTARSVTELLQNDSTFYPELRSVELAEGYTWSTAPLYVHRQPAENFSVELTGLSAQAAKNIASRLVPILAKAPLLGTSFEPSFLQAAAGVIPGRELVRPRRGVYQLRWEPKPGDYELHNMKEAAARSLSQGWPLEIGYFAPLQGWKDTFVRRGNVVEVHATWFRMHTAEGYRSYSFSGVEWAACRKASPQIMRRSLVLEVTLETPYWSGKSHLTLKMSPGAVDRRSSP